MAAPEPSPPAPPSPAIPGSSPGRGGQGGGTFASRRALAVGALVCIALILVSVNVIVSERLPARLDLTAEKLYTLSIGTRSTLAKIDEPITLRFYYSTRIGDEAPGLGVYAGRVRELLAEYAAAAKGKIRLEEYNPLPFSDAEDRAVAFGLQGVPLGGGEQGYFGLAGTNSTDDQQVIKFFAPQREPFLEYDLTKLVHALAFPKKTVVGLMTTLPLEGDIMAMMRRQPTQAMAVIDELKQLDTVETVSTHANAIPSDVDVLMVAHPQELTDQTLYAIDQFVLKGGKALFFVDPFSEMQPIGARGPSLPGGDESLNKLFKAWGFTVPADTVIGDRRNAQRVAFQSSTGQQIGDYVGWIDLHSGDIDRNDMITADLSQIRLATAGSIEPEKGAKTHIEPLLQSSPDAAKIPAEKFIGVPDVAGLAASFKPDNKRYILAARVTGAAATAFPGGPPKPPKMPAGAAKPPPPAALQVKQAVRPIDIVVAADSDMLDDRFWVQTEDLFGHRLVVPIANNGAFVANAVDVLAGGEDLIGLRTRGTSQRPFEVVERLQRAAQERYSAEEHALQQKLKTAQDKLQSLTGGDSGKAPANLSPAQLTTVAQFRADLLQTRRRLRAVQAALRSDIRRLEAWIEFFDIALVPIIVAIVAIAVGIVRIKRRSRRAAEA
jgi:ABC-type uncharacterized transport system involved in gliding motility auxiliary subunit